MVVSALSKDAESRIVRTLPGCNAEMKLGVARALAVTAVRETYEETGVLCGELAKRGGSAASLSFAPPHRLQRMAATRSSRIFPSLCILAEA